MQARRGQHTCTRSDRWQALTLLQPGKGQPGGGSALPGIETGTGSTRGVSGMMFFPGAAGGAEPLAALAASLFGLSPDS